MVTLSDERKKYKLDSKTVIKKHVEVVKKPMHLMQLNKGLNLRQQQMFNLAILHVKDGVSVVTGQDFKEVFGDEGDNFYSRAVFDDVNKLIGLNIQTSSENEVLWDNVFIRVRYDKADSHWRFEWSPYMKERIEDVRKNYIQQDLKVLAKFKSKYSFILYDYFKSNHLQWKWFFTKEELSELLRISDKKSYQENPRMLMTQCIEKPLKEINEYTEYRIEFEAVRRGKKVVGYSFKRYVTHEIDFSVTPKQIATLQEIVEHYGDMPLIMREISSLAVYDAEAVSYLTNLFFEIQAFKNFIASADTLTSEGFKDIIALAIQKDNAFKAKFREVRTRIQDRPTIDIFLEDGEKQDKPKSKFYNWLDERE